MKKKFTRSHIAKAQKIFRRLADTHQAADQPRGIVDFYYSDFVEASEGVFYPSEMSSFMTYLDEQGLVKRLAKGGPYRATRFDVTDFIKDNLSTDVEITVTKDQTQRQAIPAPVAIQETVAVADEPATQSEVTIADVNSTVKEMITYLQHSNQEMIGHLAGMINKMSFGDPELAKSLQNELLKVTAERDQLSQHTTYLQEELQKRPEHQLKKHVVIRLKNAVLDEFERYILTPSFEKNHRATYFRKEVTKHLDQLVEEVGANA